MLQETTPSISGIHTLQGFFQKIRNRIFEIISSVFTESCCLIKYIFLEKQRQNISVTSAPFFAPSPHLPAHRAQHSGLSLSPGFNLHPAVFLRSVSLNLKALIKFITPTLFTAIIKKTFRTESRLSAADVLMHLPSSTF